MTDISRIDMGVYRSVFANVAVKLIGPLIMSNVKICPEMSRDVKRCQKCPKNSKNSNFKENSKYQDMFNLSEDDKKSRKIRNTLTISENYEIKFQLCTPSQPSAQICACYKEKYSKYKRKLASGSYWLSFLT